MIGGVLFIIIVLIIAIWIFVELKRLRHKIFAIFLILLIVFTYVSAAIIFKGKQIDFKTVPGVLEAGKIYFNWLLSVFGNLKTATTYAIKMDWGNNESVS